MEQEPKNKGGAPTLFRNEYIDQVYRLCLLGLDDSELASYFEICEATLNNWKLAHPKFLESIRNGKANADSQVAKSLYDRALGYSHKDVHITTYEGEVIETPIMKHYPPDTNAARFWLNNRRPDKWRDKKEVELSGEIKTKQPDLSKLTDEELRIRAEIDKKINGA